MIAFALHGAALWLLDAPDVSPEVSPRIPPLRVAIEAAPTRESVDAESGPGIFRRAGNAAGGRGKGRGWQYGSGR